MTVDGPIDPDDLGIEEIEEEIVVSSGAYTSPLMSRAASGRLTVDMLSEFVPLMRLGEQASKRLDSGEDIPDTERHALRREAREGMRAKEILFAAALPLIRTIAQREYRRRQQWQSRVALDDLMQEAIIGFFKGLAGFKTEAIKKSPTNYLGQWMLVEMRRAAEVMDHDLQVGHDAGERFRRVRALRSRLINDLGREPTDEEISEASRNPNYVTRPGMVGRAPADGDKPAVGKGLTIAQVAEERAMRDRVGQVVRIATSDDGGEEGGVGAGFIDGERVVQSPDANQKSNDPADIVVEASASNVIATLVARALEEMELPALQAEVVSRRYGLTPYSGEASAREIARIMGIHRERVSRILTAFTAEMTAPGGTFHRIIARFTPDDLQSLNLDWLAQALGDWDPRVAAVHRVPNVLTEVTTASPTAVARATGQTNASGVLAWYQCDYEDKVFSGLYPGAAEVPKQRKCPDCQHDADLFKTTVTG